MTDSQWTLPFLATRWDVIHPGVVVPLEIGRPQSLRAVDAAVKDNCEIVVVSQREPALVDPGAADLLAIGVVCELIHVSRRSPEQQTIIVRALERVRIDAVGDDEGTPVAYLSDLDAELDLDDEATNRLSGELRRELAELIEKQRQATVEGGVDTIDDIDDPDALVDLAMAYLDMPRDHQLLVLEDTSVLARLQRVVPEIARLNEVLRVTASIRDELGEQPSQNREEVLRERKRQILEELGLEDSSAEMTALLKKIKDSAMPDEVRTVANKQAARLSDMDESMMEASITRTYLEWLLDIPWGEHTVDTLDIAAARAILDADHTGLSRVKKRILEFLAVRKLAPERRGPILCLVGPPGVGKTSLGRSIASALGRKYVRMSLGGVRDESEIRGHRRAYVGALPGRIVTGIKKSGSMNPVFVLDEIDKMSQGVRGDPAAALLEVLDPEQNHEFVDHYLDVKLDLSKVMFVATANRIDELPGPLRDRLEVIHITGYTDDEKLEIARNHLIPRQKVEHGLNCEQLQVTDLAIQAVIANYTREAGVRSLERALASLCRSAAVSIAVDPTQRVVIEPDDIESHLGPATFEPEPRGSHNHVGVSTGLSWTPTGGDLLFVETRQMPGRGGLRVTGQLGDVMNESVHAATSYVRANADRLGISDAAFAKSDLHIHVPAGGIRKDGPSAGVAITTALVSLLTGRPVRADVAITGEITLRGRVLPVGGLKEKILAAHRAGVHTVILPDRNRKDVTDLPASARDEMKLVFVSHISEALEAAFSEPPAARAVTPPVAPGMKPATPSRPLPA